MEAYCKALGNNEYYEQVLKVISLLDRPDLKALTITTEKWYEIDDVQDLDIASTIFSCSETNFETLLTEYPSGMQENAQLAARYAGISSEQIIVGNGAAELISGYMRMTSKYTTGVILPTFEENPNRLDPKQLVYYTPSNRDFSYTALTNRLSNF